MRATLDHLPEKKQYEITRIVEIIKEVMHPEKILLFGSYAKGNFVENRYYGGDGVLNEYISDYDILIVTKADLEKPYLQESTIMDRVDRYQPPVNLEIHAIKFVNEGLMWGQYFFTDIVNEGILLFDTGNYEFAKPKILSPLEEKIKAKDYFEIWFPRASGFLKVASYCLSENDLKVGVFNLHQAAESLYFTLLLVFTGYKPRLHNLWKLRKKTKAYSEKLFSVFQAETDKKEEQLFDLLKRGYIEARYNKDYAINEDELSVLIERVKSMATIVEDLCASKI